MLVYKLVVSSVIYSSNSNLLEFEWTVKLPQENKFHLNYFIQE